MKRLRHLAFTLIELLVVISIIGILAALAIPAVAGALVKGQLTGTLNNARQLQLATFNVNLENESVGIEGAWPSSNVNFTTWMSNVSSVLSENDLKKLFAAPGVAVTNTPTGPAQTAFRIYQVGNNEESSAIFLTTRNLLVTANATNLTTNMVTPTAKPYGDKGTVLMRRGGDGQVVPRRLLTNVSIAPQPAELAN